MSKSGKLSKGGKSAHKTGEPQSLVTSQIKKPNSRSKYDPLKANRGIVLVKHLPHGFFEEQIRKYFEQFGKITRIRLARSERTGNSRGFGFIEFAFPEVAEVAAETMNNYIMFKEVLQTVYIPPDQQKFNYFKTNVRIIERANGTKIIKTPKTLRITEEVKKINKPKTLIQHKKILNRNLNKLKSLQEKYNKIGVDCNFNILEESSDEAAGAFVKHIIRTPKTARDFNLSQSAFFEKMTGYPMPSSSDESFTPADHSDENDDSDRIAEELKDLSTESVLEKRITIKSNKPKGDSKKIQKKGGNNKKLFGKTEKSSLNTGDRLLKKTNKTTTKGGIQKKQPKPIKQIKQITPSKRVKFENLLGNDNIVKKVSKTRTIKKSK